MTDIERIENESFAPENGAENKTDDKTERMFTQSELEEIISERLSRERKKNESLLSVKTLLKGAAEKGLLKGNSYAEMAKELVERLKGSPTAEAEDKTEEVPEGAKTGGNAETSHDDGQEYSADADAEEEKDAGEAGGSNDGDENTANDENEGFMSLLCDIKSKYPKGDVEKLFSGDLFERFAKGRSGSMREIVDDFFSFVSSLGIKEDTAGNTDGYSSFASTAFSSNAGTIGTGANLTKQQMEIAKSAGMSYREYANLLESVPKRAARTN
ncbi:MAG: hypothetical protein IJ939_02130 [Clostridia bacterium]|nr:hypothetical protein [Clostridia bacterium]